MSRAPASRLVSRATLAVGRGELDVAVVLQRSLRPGFRGWLERKIDSSVGTQVAESSSAKTAPRRRARVAVRAVRRLLERLEIVPLSVHWGWMRRRGTLDALRAGVVVILTTKLPRLGLPQKARIPRHVRFTLRGRPCVIRIDIQAAGGPGRLHGARDLEPGAQATVRVGSNEGTLSGVLEADSTGARRAVLSGHVALAAGAAVSASSPSAGGPVDLGRVVRVLLPGSGDLALAGPASPNAGLLCLSARAIRDPNEMDLSATVHVLVASEPGGVAARVTDVGCDAVFRTTDGDVRVTGLLALEQVTQPGDSGAAVVDWRGQVIGFVVGVFARRTMAMPARRALDALLSP